MSHVSLSPAVSPAPSTPAHAGLPPGLHTLAKPAGPLCNLDCNYCFYLEKESFFPARHRFLMSDAVLEALVRQQLTQDSSPEVLFTWQGGEPLLRGLDFYRRAVALQKQWAGSKTVRNSLQTNGLLLDDEWCAFLAQEGFEVGISLDGPAHIHDPGRPDKQGRPTHARVMAAIERLRARNIPFNVLVTVTDAVSREPLAVYRFLRDHGLHHVQFNPVVERTAQAGEQAIGLTFAEPPPPGYARPVSLSAATSVSPHSVRPHAYGEFLVAVFDEWVRHDVGTVFVMNFEWALAAYMGLPATVCLFAENCGKAVMLEHNGDLYSCDHYMYPSHRLGNLLEQPLAELVNQPQQQTFGLAKSASLPAMCRRCEFLVACRGECPKNRFAVTPDGEAGLNYLCPSYKRYFGHIARYLRVMAQLIQLGQPASLVMEAIKGPLAIHQGPIRG